VSSYPNFAGKHAEEAFFSAQDFAAYLRLTRLYEAALAALAA
jgi:hypothetical protein